MLRIEYSEKIKQVKKNKPANILTQVYINSHVVVNNYFAFIYQYKVIAI